MCVTFKEFIDSRKFTSNLSRAVMEGGPLFVDGDEQDVNAIKGYVYMDCCYILINDNGDAELIIGNEDIIDDLDKLEEELYVWYLNNH